MPLYFFHIYDRNRVIADHAGQRFPDPLTARREAIKVMDELVGDGLWSDNSHSGRHVEIVDDQAQLVATVALWELADEKAR